VSEYHVHAAIAATYARARVPQSLNWPLILSLYDQLVAINASPVVILNRAVALGKVHGPEAALAVIAPLSRDRKLRHYHLLMAVRGHFLLELGRATEAADAFHAALECAGTEPERRFLERKIRQSRESGNRAIG
jgi:RNA polymerase sigma-70 factor, ECF subfamily